MKTTPCVSYILCTFWSSLFWTLDWKQTHDSRDTYIGVFFAFKIREHQSTKKVCGCDETTPHTFSFRETALYSFGYFMQRSQRKHTSLSEDLHRANTYRVTHCLFRLNSSKRNPGVPEVVSLLHRQLRWERRCSGGESTTQSAISSALTLHWNYDPW